MRINEIILENSTNETFETIPITNKFGGGKIEVWGKIDEKTNEVGDYSFTYTNDKINGNLPVIKCDGNEDGATIYHHSKFPGGIELGRNSTNMDARKEFANAVTPYIRDFFNKGYNMNDTQNESINTTDIWNKDGGLKRAATLMDRIAASADRHRAKMNGLMENTPSKNPQDTLRDIFKK
jgi:hypothetical protein